MDIVTYALARKGLELKIPNIIKNGDFSQGLDEWEPVNQLSAGIEITEDGALFKGRYLAYAPHQLIPIKANHVYYISQKAKNIDTPDALMAFGNGRVREQVILVYINQINETEFTRVSATIKANNNYTSFIPFNFESNQGVERKIIIDDVLMLDLTEIFGVDNEPTKEEMDTLVNLIPNSWWDGTLKPTQKQLITWLLNLIRENRNAIIALGGSI